MNQHLIEIEIVEALAEKGEKLAVIDDCELVGISGATASGKDFYATFYGDKILSLKLTP